MCRSSRSFLWNKWLTLGLGSSGLLRGVLVVVYRRFGTDYRSHLYGSSSPRRLDCLTLEDGTNRLFRNVGQQLPTQAAWQPRRTKTSSTPRREPEVWLNLVQVYVTRFRFRRNDGTQGRYNWWLAIILLGHSVTHRDLCYSNLKI
jgi:hypothetical protein